MENSIISIIFKWINFLKKNIIRFVNVETDPRLQYSSLIGKCLAFLFLCVLWEISSRRRTLGRYAKGRYLYERTNQKTWPQLPNSFTKPAGFFQSFLNPWGYITKSKNCPTWMLILIVPIECTGNATKIVSWKVILNIFFIQWNLIQLVFYLIHIQLHVLQSPLRG
jgi:hypothetical protein